MTSVAADQLSLCTPSLWTWLLEAAGDVAKALAAHRKLTSEEMSLYGVAEEFGGVILDANDVADLRTRLYAIARDERLLRWEFEVLRDLGDLKPWPNVKVAQDSFAMTFGDSRLVRECARLMTARVDVLVQVFAMSEHIEIAEDAAEVLQRALQDFRSPPGLRSLFEETLAGEAALVGLFASLMDPERWQCPPWLRFALLEQVRLASVSHLRLLSVIPQVHIPEDVLPRDEHLDVHELERESRELAAFVLPTEIRVPSEYADALMDALEGDTAPPAGAQALFMD
jgi:hypothetical protein